MGGVPLVIVVLGIVNLARALTRRGTIILQVLASLAIWIFLTYIIVMIFIMVVFSLPYPLSTVDELKSNLGFLVATLIYAVVGAGLIFWTRAQAKLSRPVSSN